MKRIQHPGSILFDEDGVLEEVDAVTLPECMRFAPAATGELEPVVQVVCRRNRGGIHVRVYGESGKLLKSTALLKVDDIRDGQD